MIFGYFTLIVALIISAVAAYYSIVGLTAIFSAAVIPIIIMGAALEVGKVTAAVWLKINWARARWTYKIYLVPAVAFLMLLTSMGIFGFLSKAHSDQSLISGDVQSKIALYDEKIKIAKENIDANRRALKQLDEAVDQVMGRSTTETGAERSVQIRRQQGPERQRLIREIETEQKKISALNEERAPIAAEVRKVEAEVGPIKYIAALIYGDNPDNDLLERAVRWVIIIIVAVFDPLALVLILAAQQSLRWAKEDKIALAQANTEQIEPNNNDQDQDNQDLTDQTETAQTTQDPADQQVETPGNLLNEFPYLNQGFGRLHHPPGVDQVPPQIYREQTPVQLSQATDDRQVDPQPANEPLTTEVEPNKVDPLAVVETADIDNTQSNVALPSYTTIGDGYVNVQGKVLHERVLPDTHPEVLAEIQRKRIDEQLMPQADNDEASSTTSRATFGTSFPADPVKGEMFLNVSVLPSRLYKYNGSKWITVDKTITDAYTYNDDYLRYLAEQIATGVVAVEDLTTGEQDQIEQYLKKNVQSPDNTA